MDGIKAFFDIFEKEALVPLSLFVLSTLSGFIKDKRSKKWFNKTVAVDSFVSYSYIYGAVVIVVYFATHIILPIVSTSIFLIIWTLFEFLDKEKTKHHFYRKIHNLYKKRNRR